MNTVEKINLAFTQANIIASSIDHATSVLWRADTDSEYKQLTHTSKTILFGMFRQLSPSYISANYEHPASVVELGTITGMTLCITSGSLFSQFVSYLDTAHCFNAPCGTTQDIGIGGLYTMSEPTVLYTKAGGAGEVIRTTANTLIDGMDSVCIDARASFGKCLGAGDLSSGLFLYVRPDALGLPATGDTVGVMVFDTSDAAAASRDPITQSGTTQHQQHQHRQHQPRMYQYPMSGGQQMPGYQPPCNTQHDGWSPGSLNPCG